MIVAHDDGRLRFVTQPDHAHLSARLLELWRDPALVDHPRRRDLLAAVREHDNGWRELDAAPRVDPTSRKPFTFRDLPTPYRLELWERGTTRFVAQRPYLALLVTTHALNLHRGQREDGDWGPMLETMEQRREELIERCGLTRAEIALDYRWLALVDALSLAVCGDHPGPITVFEGTAHWSDGELSLAPFPLAGATTFRFACRWLRDRPFSGDADLAVALATAPWKEQQLRVVPG